MFSKKIIFLNKNKNNKNIFNFYKINFFYYSESKIFDGLLSSRDNKNEEKSDYEVFKDNPSIKTIYNDKDLLDRCTAALKRIQTTPPNRSSNNIDSWFSHESDVNTITIGAKTNIKCSLLKIIAILAEVDFMSNFVSRFDSITKLQEYSLFRWLIQIRIKMPVTITNREIVAMGFGCVNPDDSTILMPFRSVNEKHYDFIKLPKEDKKFLRIDIIFGFFYIKYIDEENVEVINCYNVDPKVPVIPWFLLNTFLREISYYIMSDLKKQIEEVDFALYEERINRNRRLYDRIMETLKEKITKNN